MTETLLARLRAQLPALAGAERVVGETILARADDIIELSSAQLAEIAGVSRPTVVRTCQSLGLTGYQQLRVLLAREGAATAGGAAAPPRTTVGATFAHVGESIAHMSALLDDDDIERAVAAIAGARRVITVGHGFSAPLALDTASRLTASGRVAERYADVMDERIAIAGLGPDDVVLVVSGSGSNRLSLDAAAAARTAGAQIIAITAFSHAPLSDLAGTVLVTGMPDASFRDELLLTTRIPQTILLEGLLLAVGERLGAAGREAKRRAVEIVSDYVSE